MTAHPRPHEITVTGQRHGRARARCTCDWESVADDTGAVLNNLQWHVKATAAMVHFRWAA